MQKHEGVPLFALVLVVLVALVLIVIRAEFAATMLNQRIAEIHEHNDHALDTKEWNPEMMAHYDQLPSLYAIAFDLRKWTYQQCFPEPLK